MTIVWQILNKLVFFLLPMRHEAKLLRLNEYDWSLPRSSVQHPQHFCHKAMTWIVLSNLMGKKVEWMLYPVRPLRQISMSSKKKYVDNYKKKTILFLLLVKKMRPLSLLTLHPSLIRLHCLNYFHCFYCFRFNTMYTVSYIQIFFFLSYI